MDRYLTVYLLACMLLLASFLSVLPVIPAGHPVREYWYIAFVSSVILMALFFRMPLLLIPIVIGWAVYDVLRVDVFWTVQVPLFAFVTAYMYEKRFGRTQSPHGREPHRE